MDQEPCNWIEEDYEKAAVLLLLEKTPKAKRPHYWATAFDTLWKMTPQNRKNAFRRHWHHEFAYREVS